MLSDAIVATVRFELTRAIRDRITWFVLALFIGIASIGAFLYWNALPPRPTGTRMLGDAFVYALMVGFHLGIANDRASGFDTYLTSNFLHPADLYFAKVLSGLVFLLAFGCFAMLIGLATALGDVRFVAPLVGRLLVFFLFALPLVIVFELTIPTRFPTLLLATSVMVALMIASKAWDQKEFLVITGLDGVFSPAEIALRLAITIVLISAFYPLYRIRFRMNLPARI